MYSSPWRDKSNLCHVQDRDAFTHNFTVARGDLQTLLAKHGKTPAGKPNDLCTIM